MKKMQLVYYFMHCKGGFVYFRKIGLHLQTSIYVLWNESSVEYGPVKTKIEWL